MVTLSLILHSNGQESRPCIPAGTRIAETLRTLLQDPDSVLEDPVYGPVEEWCFEALVDFSGAFQGMEDIPWNITAWKTSGVTDFSSAFDGCTNFNQDISGWDTRDAKNFSYMFRNAKSFDQDISSWRVSKVEDFTEMFRGASSFSGGIGKTAEECFRGSLAITNATFECGCWKDCHESPNFVSEYEETYKWCRDENFIGCWFTYAGKKYDRMFQGATSFDGYLSPGFDFKDATYDDILTDTFYAPLNDNPGCAHFLSGVRAGEYEYPIDITGGTENAIRIRQLTMIIPRVFAMLSMLSSLYIVVSLIGTKQSREKTKTFWFFRMLLGLSSFDVVSSFGYFLMDWPMPSEFPGLEGINHQFSDLMGEDWELQGRLYSCFNHYYHEYWYPYASGTIATCTIQGFVIHVGLIGSMLFTAWLSVGFVLMVKYNWREQKLMKLQWVLVIFTCLLAFGSAIFLAVEEYFNPVSTGFCWIGKFGRDVALPGVPYEEIGERFRNNFERGGQHLEIYQLVFAQLWVGLVLITIIISLTMVFFHVRSTEARNKRYGSHSFRRNISSSDKQSSSLQGDLRNNNEDRNRLSDKEILVMKKGFSYGGESTLR